MDQVAGRPADDTPLGPMLHADGSCFADLEALSEALSALSNVQREQFRDSNAEAIAACGEPSLLILAGPGSGKTHLFKMRIREWVLRFPNEAIYVSSFVRKLVNDLRSEIDESKELTDDDKARVTVTTLHTLARSIAEKGHGTEAEPFRPYIRVIDSYWQELVFDDVLAFHPESPRYRTDDLARYYNGVGPVDDDWPDVEATYRRLCRFYNAVGFAYMIQLAFEVASTKPEIVQERLWIVDEYQDFNVAEDRLIAALTDSAVGVLRAGDDDQALYQTLKGATPEIVVGYYKGAAHANAMLPYCSRCSYHLCLAASSFIATHRTNEAVQKVYLPLVVDENAARVQVIASPTAASAVDYVRKFLSDSGEEFNNYLERRSEGKEKDPFLLVLSGTGTLTMKGVTDADNELAALLAEYTVLPPQLSAAYYRVVAYYAAFELPNDNYALRKVLAYENVPLEAVHELIVAAMANNDDFHAAVEAAFPGILDRVRLVGAAVEISNEDPGGAAARIAEVLPVGAVEVLADELAASPIGKGVADLEDEEAIETAAPGLPPVVMMSMVGSKGLSAHHVVVVGCDDMNMRLVTPLTFFVAMTRARKTLHVIASRKTGGSATPHKFIGDIPEEHCTFISHGKGKQVDLGSRAAFLAQFDTWRKGEEYGKKIAAKKKAARKQ